MIQIAILLLGSVLTGNANAKKVTAVLTVRKNTVKTIAIITEHVPKEHATVILGIWEQLVKFSYVLITVTTMAYVLMENVTVKSRFMERLVKNSIVLITVMEMGSVLTIGNARVI